MAQTDANKALKKIEIHEAECALRYEAINKRLDSGSERFDKWYVPRVLLHDSPFFTQTI